MLVREVHSQGVRHANGNWPSGDVGPERRDLGQEFMQLFEQSI
jgi:hypothetical protein